MESTTKGYFKKWMDYSAVNLVYQRICLYLFTRYFGQFFKEKLDSDKLNVNLLKGTVQLNNILLDVQALNDLAEKQKWPIEFIDGYIEEIRVTIPYSRLLVESCTVHVTGLHLTTQPKQRSEPVASVFESMWTSMSSSMQLAEELVHQEPTSETDDGPQQTYEGVEVFAEAIDSVLSRVKVDFIKSVFRLIHKPKGSSTGIGLVFNVDLITYCDECCDNPTKDKASEQPKEEKAYLEKSFMTKISRIKGLTLSTLEFLSKPPKSVRPDLVNDDFASVLDDGSQDEDDDIEDYLTKYSPEDAVMFAKFFDKMEVITTMKHTEDLKGSKVSIESHIGRVSVVLTPRQIQLLTELADGFRSADLVDQMEFGGRPMTSENLENVRRDLQKQNVEDAMRQYNSGLYGACGWSTNPLDNPEGNVPLRSRTEDLFESMMSAGSVSMESSMSSSVTSCCTENTSRTHRRMNRVDLDPTAEISHFQVHIVYVSIVLLHEDILAPSSTDLNILSPSSIKQLGRVVENFFLRISDSTLGDDLISHHPVFDEACYLNHLRLLASGVHLEADEKTTSTAFAVSGYLEANRLELSECLYQANKSPENTILLHFNDRHSPAAKSQKEETTADSSPNLKLVFKHIERVSNGVPFRGPTPKTELTFTLSRCSVDFDLTIIDRISALLHSELVCKLDADYNQWKTSLMEVLPSKDARPKIEVKVSSPGIEFKLRFPMPDFRPPHDIQKTPWWKKHVRQDYLSFYLTNFSFQTVIGSDPNDRDYSFKCHSVDASYCESEHAFPIPVAKAGFSDKSTQDPSAVCRFDISRRPPLPDLEEVRVEQSESMGFSSGAFMADNKPNGPFSTKRVVHESDTPHNRTQLDTSEELLLPGEKHEIDEFKHLGVTSAGFQLDISLPVLSMQLLSKHTYELIYNRINNDLLMWEPSAPKPKANTYDSYGVGHLDVESQEVFYESKSGISCESDSESNSDEPMFYSTYGRMKPPPKPKKKLNGSYLSLKLKVGRGLLCLFAPARDSTTDNVIPGQHGEFLINVEDAELFVVNGYMGDMDLGYVCLEVSDAQLHHCDMTSTPSQSPPLKDIGTAPGKHLSPTIYKSESGMLPSKKLRGGNRKLLTLAVKIQASHETHHVKNVTLAAGFNKVTLRHRMSSASNSWITQLMDFFNVSDYPIPGYKPKDIMTEMHVHFWDSAIDYRPKHLPLRAALTIANFTISSHLTAEVNTTTLRFIAEESFLFLSQKGVLKGRLPYSGPVHLTKDYVCVIEVGLFEISLKTYRTERKNSDTPHFDLRASNNAIHIRTCADSATCLTQLLQYLANNGDLLAPEDLSGGASNASTPRHQPKQELVKVETEEAKSVSTSQYQHINNLIDEAINDEATGTLPQPVQPEFCSHQAGAKVFYFPDGTNQAGQDFGLPIVQVVNELGPTLPTVNRNIDDEFCFIENDPEMFNVLPKDGLPKIEWLTDEPVRIIDNYFSVPLEKIDPLQTPKTYPTPVSKYTLCEMGVTWVLYGGNDFGNVDKELDKKKKVSFVDSNLSDTVSFSNDRKGEVNINRETKSKPQMSWLVRGGPCRDHDVVMEFQFSKIRFQHDVYPESSDKASRQVLLIGDVEIRDRLKSSQINKFLYQYTSQSMPKQSNANMLMIKAIHVRDHEVKRQECVLKVSMLPLGFNIDQDALIFLMNFFSELGGGSPCDDDLPVVGSKHSTPSHQPPVLTMGAGSEDKINPEEAKKIVDENLLILLEENRSEDGTDDELTESTSTVVEDSPIYFRKVVFAPAVPIRLDYTGKHVDMSHGSLPGLLLGLAQLNCSELRLKTILHRHGLLGVEKLLAFLVQEWLADIKKNQLGAILSGVGPMYPVMQLFQGMKDLFWLPVEQYKKDGRILRGLHRGANSFTTSTAMAALELTTRLIHLIQITAETAFDMLTPGPSVRIHPKTKTRRKRYGQPKDIREGIANAVMLVKEGIEETADNILQVAAHEHEQKGYSGAVGGVIRQLPSSCIKPFILASEATNNLLDGVRSQLVPDARREAGEKWRKEDV